MELRVLGSLEVRGQDRPVRRRTRVLLGVLCLRANAPVSSDLLLDALWGAAPPPSAPANLRSSVADLRRSVPAIGSRPGGYVLRADATTLDCLAFTELADEGREHLESGDFDLAAARLAAASALWRGPVLDGLTVPELVRPAARLLEDRRLEVAEDAVDARLALGDHARLAEELRSSVDEQPLRERRWRQWMVALYRCGRQAEALEAYRELHRLLDDELGVRPGPEARRLHERILDGAPDLDPPPVAVRRPPRQLPPDVPGFVGRAGALAELDVPRGTVVVSAVSGTAGVGKTALAVRWAHAAATRFPDGCLYADLRGFGPGRPAAPEEVLAGFLRALGVGDPPAGVAELSARFRSELSDRRVLVVLDNAASPAQVRPLLAGAPGCRTVVTSRDSLAGLVARDGAHRVHLDLLSPDEACALLVGLIGERAERDPEAVAELARRCARLPLALRVAAELAVARPDASVRRLVDELAERGLDVLDAGGDGDTAVRAVFSWSVDALPVGAARAFGLLGVHPGRVVGSHAAAALVDADLAVTRGVLDVLVRAHLVRPVGPDRFGMHDLLREYAAERADDGEAVRRLLDHYRCAAATAMDLLYPFESDRRPKPPPSGTPLPLLTVDTAQAWLDAERANLVAAGVHAAEHGLGGHTVDLSALLWRDFTTGAHYPEALALHDAARRAAVAGGDVSGEATAHNLLGIVRYRLGEYPAAVAHYDRARELRERSGDRVGVATTLTNLGVLLWETGRLPEALERLLEALALQRELGLRAVEGSTLGNIGVVHWFLGDFARAVEFNQRALEIHREVGDRVGEAMNLNNLASAYRRMGRFAEAAECSRAELASARARGNRDGEAAALTGLGQVSVLSGAPEAEELLVAALALHRETGSAAGEAEVRAELGRLRGDRAEVERALAAARDLGARPLETTALIELARVLLARGDVEGAAERAREAFGAAERIGDRFEQARALETAARATGGEGWDEVVRRYTEMGVPVPVR